MTVSICDLASCETTTRPLTAAEDAALAATRAEAEAARPAGMIAAIKAEAGQRIGLLCPDWKQRNLTARAAELAIKGQASWSAEEAAEVAAGQAVWQAIKAIRARSDQLEAQVAAMAPAQLGTFHPADPAHWAM